MFFSRGSSFFLDWRPTIHFNGAGTLIQFLPVFLHVTSYHGRPSCLQTLRRSAMSLKRFFLTNSNPLSSPSSINPAFAKLFEKWSTDNSRNPQWSDLNNMTTLLMELSLYRTIITGFWNSCTVLLYTLPTWELGPPHS